jgi:hypothetical protein
MSDGCLHASCCFAINHTYIHTYTYIHAQDEYEPARLSVVLPSTIHACMHTHTYIHTYTGLVGVRTPLGGVAINLEDMTSTHHGQTDASPNGREVPSVRGGDSA